MSSPPVPHHRLADRMEPPVVILDIAPEPGPAAFTEQQIQVTVPSLLQPPPRPKRRHRNRKSTKQHGEDSDEEINTEYEAKRPRRRKNQGQTIRIAPVSTACTLKSLPDIFENVLTQITQAQPTVRRYFL